MEKSVSKDLFKNIIRIVISPSKMQTWMELSRQASENEARTRIIEIAKKSYRTELFDSSMEICNPYIKTIKKSYDLYCLK